MADVESVGGFAFNPAAGFEAGVLFCPLGLQGAGAAWVGGGGHGSARPGAGAKEEG